MTFEPRKGGTGLAAVLAALDQRMENEGEVLGAFLLALMRNQLPPEAWTKLFGASQRDDRLAELAFAFEELSQDRRIKTLSPPMLAEFFYRAGSFFGDVFSDETGAVVYLEKAVAASTDHQAALERLELALAGNAKKRAELYATVAPRRPKPEQAEWWRKAAAAFAEAGVDEKATEAYQQVIKLEPGDADARGKLASLLELQGKSRDLIKLLEGALAQDSPADEANDIRLRLLRLHEHLREPEKALVHAEALLAVDPTNGEAHALATRLLDSKTAAAKAAGMLAQASETLGNSAEVARYLAIELEHTRGPKRATVLRKLATLRQDVLGDLQGAFEALEAAIALDPGDEEVRQRYTRVVRALGKQADAVKTLQRLASVAKDPPVRARLTVEMGEMLLATGDAKRARAALASALSAPGIDNAGIVAAALGLAGIYESEGDHASLADMLERVAQLDTIEQRRWAACERLAEVASGPLQEPARAVIAWRGLLNSPLRARALEALEDLLAQIGDRNAQAEVLLERARDLEDPTAAREAMMRAADALSESPQTNRASAVLREAFERFGAARDLVARWKPLLETERDWAMVEKLLEADAVLAEADERPGILAELGRHRLQYNRDPKSAIESFAGALAIDPSEPSSRTALEQLMASDDGVSVLAAADVLEPIYRAEASRGGVVRVLSARAARAATPQQRLGAIREAIGLAAALPTEQTRAVDLVRRGLVETLELGEPVRPWLDQLKKLQPEPEDAIRRADVLYKVLGVNAADPKALAMIARAAGDALVQADDNERALFAYRRAIELEPDASDLVGIVDELLARSGTAADRLAFYQQSLHRESDRLGRRRLFHTMANLQRKDLGDPGAAMKTLAFALHEDPDDSVAADTLADLYEEHEMWPHAAQVLEARLARAPNDDGLHQTHARLATLAARSGDAESAIRHCHALLGAPTPEDLDLAQRVAEGLNHAPLLVEVMRARAANAATASDRSAWLARLGEAEAQSDPRAAAATLKEAARLADEEGDIARARPLYEKVRKLSPFDPDITRRLVAIAEQNDEQTVLPGLYTELAECAPTEQERYEVLGRMARVLSERDPGGAVDAAARAFESRPADVQALEQLEHYAMRAGQPLAFVRAIDAATGRTLRGDADEPRTFARWARARARGLAAADGEHEEASKAFRGLLDDEQAPIDERLGAADDYEKALARWGNSEGEIAWASEWRKRHFELAVDALRESASRATGDAKRKLRLDLALLLVGSPDRAEEAVVLLDEILADSADVATQREVLTQLLAHATKASKEQRGAWHEKLLALTKGAPPAERYAAVLRALGEAADREEWWDEAERLARELDDPKPLAAELEAVIAGTPSIEIASSVGQRAVAFNEEWFDDTRGVERILDRLLTIDPQSWAFDRLKLLYDAAERWDDLFALYDRVLVAATGSRKAELLEDAAQVAKDFAGHSERAIGYLEQLLALKPKTPRIVASLERLYERHERHRPLVDLLSLRLPDLPPADAQKLRSRIAGIWLDQLHDAGSALLVVEEMIGAGDEGNVDDLLSRILTSASTTEEVRKTLPPAAPGEDMHSVPPPRASVPPRGSVPPPAPSKGRSKRVLVRQRAAAILKERYGEAGRERDLVRVLEIELESVKNAKERIRRHREIADLYVKLDDHASALEHSVALVLLEPDVASHREKLAELAERVGRLDRYAEVLAAAADDCADENLRVELLVQAADVRAEKLGDDARAIDLYSRVLGMDAPNEAALQAAQKLDVLLAKAERVHERLSVLERMAQLETNAEKRRSALGTLASLATSVDEVDRAIAAWAARLEHDPADIEALDGTVALLEGAKRWAELVTILRARAKAVGGPDARTDRVRVARILSNELGNPAGAIEVWQEIEAEFGESDDGTFSLATLFADMERWSDLATLLQRAADRATTSDRKAALLRRLGDIQREHLGVPEDAVRSYEAALTADPTDEGALGGLQTMLGQAHVAPSVLGVLIDTFRRTDAWRRILELTDYRLKFAEDDPARVLVLREVATIAEERAEDLGLAFDAMRKAFAAGRGDDAIAEELMRLATSTNSWRAFADAHRQAIDAAETGTWRDGELLARLRMRLGRVLETHLDDARGALAAYARVASDTPGDAVACVAAIRVAGRVARWDVAAKVLVDHSVAVEAIPDALTGALEDAAAGPAAWDATTGAFAAAIAERGDLPHHLARELEARLAVWHLDRRGDPDAAEAAYARALAHDPQSVHILQRLADLQRRAKGRPLIDSLLRLSQATGGDLDLLREAAEVATSVVGDRGLAKTIVERLFRLGVERWVGASASASASASTGSPASPGTYVDWALGELIRIHNEEGNAERIVELLVEASHLPFDTDRSRAMRHDAARVAVDRIGDFEGALALYLELFEDDPQDTEAATRLAQLYAQLGRNAQLLSLRRRQVEIAKDSAPRMALRREVARLERTLGKPDAAIEELRANLAESARDPETTSALAATLEELGRWEELAHFSTDQAQLAEQAGDQHAAADLWARAAELAETKLNDPASAIAHHRRVVRTEMRAPSLDALARLLEAQRDFEAAADYLDRLAQVATDDKTAVIARLADALSMADRLDVARVRLEQSLADDPSAIELSERLAKIYRKKQEWAPLAELLTKSARYAKTPAEKLERLREAAELYAGPCKAPDLAIPLLEEASSLAPDDRRLKLAHADALGAAGRVDDARSLLKLLVEGFGGRRPKERAQVHFHLARLHLRSNERQRALLELDAAMRIDAANPEIQRTIAELARDDGQLEKAERAYRALLSLVRKSDDEDAPVLRSEVLVELSDIARRQDEGARAEEILESAFEAAMASDAEARRLEKTLRTKNQHAALVRAMEARIARLEGPAAGEALGELALVLDKELGRTSDAATALLRAVALAPTSASVHDAALEIAQRANRTSDYAAALDACVEVAKKAGEMRQMGQLLLRRSRLAEDPAEAARILEIARKAGPPAASLEVLRTLDRFYVETGDLAAQEAVLGELVELEVETTSRDPRTAAEALYRLAELRSKTDRASEVAQLLSAATDLAPDVPRASRIADEAGARLPDDPSLLELREKFARASGDSTALARALLRRAEVAQDPLPILEEAVRVAESTGDDDLAEEAHRRCETRARGRDDLLALRSLMRLAALREKRGDRREALRISLEAADLEDAKDARTTRISAASAARELRDFELAASAYEHMLQVDPRDVDAALGLVDVLSEAGKTDALSTAIGRALEIVEEPQKRAELRLERAKLLVGPLGRSEDAIDDLREAFEMMPDRDDVATLLADLLSRLGRSSELEELVVRQLESAKDRGDNAAVAAFSLRVAQLAEGRPDRQREILAHGLDWEPKHPGLLRAMLGVLTRKEDAQDRASVLDRLLGVAEAPEAETLALELAGILAESWDAEGAERALERGLAANPHSSALRERLFQLYAERGDMGKLAELHERTSEGDDRPARLREAARLYQELGRPADAARVLGQLRELVPDDADVLDALVENASASGDLAGAIREIGTALASAQGPRVSALFARRASLRLAQNDVKGALEDARAAHTGDAHNADLLAEILERAATEADDPAERRDHQLALIDVLRSSGRAHDARARLASLQSGADDPGILRALAHLDIDAENWSAAAQTLGKLVMIEDKDHLVSTALLLAECSTHAGNAAYAREGLERAYATFSEETRIISALGALYAAIGATEELVTMELSLARRGDAAEKVERLVRLGGTLLDQGHDPRRACSILAEAYEQRPGDIECGSLLAEALRRSDREDDAITLLQTMITSQRGRRNKDLAGVYHRLATIERDRGDHASEMTALASALDMDAQNGVVASDLADVAMRLGQLEVATKALRAITMLRNPAPGGAMPRAVAYQHLGEIAHMQGDTKRAVMLLKRAVDEDATLTRARDLLNELQAR